MTTAIDMTGERCHGWTIIRRAAAPGRGYEAWWLCRCDCGSEKIEVGKALRSGVSRACHNAVDPEPDRTACTARLWDEHPCLDGHLGHKRHFYDIRRERVN